SAAAPRPRDERPCNEGQQDGRRKSLPHGSSRTRHGDRENVKNGGEDRIVAVVLPVPSLQHVLAVVRGAIGQDGSLAARQVPRAVDLDEVAPGGDTAREGWSRADEHGGEGERARGEPAPWGTRARRPGITSETRGRGVTGRRAARRCVGPPRNSSRWGHYAAPLAFRSSTRP